MNSYGNAINFLLTPLKNEQIQPGNINRAFSDFIRDVASSFSFFPAQNNCRTWWIDSETSLVAVDQWISNHSIFATHFSFKLATLWESWRLANATAPAA